MNIGSAGALTRMRSWWTAGSIWNRKRYTRPVTASTRTVGMTMNEA